MQKNKTTLDKSVIQKIMNRAIQISKSCKEACRDFEIMVSVKHEYILILRWLTIDISNVDNPIQKYHYECFEPCGTPQLCSIHYNNIEEANDFFLSLTPLYNQQFAIDHTL